MTATNLCAAAPLVALLSLGCDSRFVMDRTPPRAPDVRATGRIVLVYRSKNTDRNLARADTVRREPTPA